MIDGPLSLAQASLQWDCLSGKCPRMAIEEDWDAGLLVRRSLGMHGYERFGGNWPATARLCYTSAASGEATAAALPSGRAATPRCGLLLPCPERHVDPRARGTAAATAGSAAGRPTG